MSLRGNADLSAERTLSQEHHETLAIVPPGDPTPRSTSSAPPSHGDRGKNTLSQLGHSVRLNESMSYKAPHRATQRPTPHSLTTVSPASVAGPDGVPVPEKRYGANERKRLWLSKRSPLRPREFSWRREERGLRPATRLRPAHGHDTRPSRFQHFAVNSTDQISFSFPKVGLLYCFITCISY